MENEAWQQSINFNNKEEYILAKQMAKTKN